MRIAMRMRSLVHGSAGLEESSVRVALTSSKTLMAYSQATCPCLSLRRICSGSDCRHLKPTSALNSLHVRRAACSGTGRVILRYSWRAGRGDRREIERQYRCVLAVNEREKGKKDPLTLASERRAP